MNSPPISAEVEAALTLLGLEPESVVTQDEVKAAFKKLAKAAHPDVEGGSDELMKRLNLAYETAHKWVMERVAPKCVCLGFTRNKMCRAHEEPKSGEQCPECGGTKRVWAGEAYTKIQIDCPKCT